MAIKGAAPRLSRAVILSPAACAVCTVFLARFTFFFFSRRFFERIFPRAEKRLKKVVFINKYQLKLPPSDARVANS
jgi:hypothetical protein